MASYAYSVILDTVTLKSQSGTASEKVSQTVKIPGLASDTSIMLGLLTNPRYIIVSGAEGISIKLGAGGVDAIGADPIAVIANEDGLGHDRILISNSGAQEQEVTI